MSIAEIFKNIDSKIQSSKKMSFGEQWFATLGSEKSIAPMKHDTFVIASGIHNLCPRYEILRAEHDITITKNVSPELSVIFDIGDLYHHFYRNWHFGPSGLFLGSWKCLVCEETTDGDEVVDGVPIKSFLPGGSFPSNRPLRLIQMPQKCPHCGTKRFASTRTANRRIVDSKNNLIVFNEWLLENHEFYIRAYPDGWERDRYSDEIFTNELKSISQYGFNQIIKDNKPKPEHKTQCMVCCWMSGYKDGYIVYLNKAAYKDPDHFVFKAKVSVDEVWMEANVWKPITILRKHLKHGTMAERICIHKNTPRAAECDLVNLCFKEKK